MRHVFISILLFLVSRLTSQSSPVGLTPVLADSFYFSSNWKESIPLYIKAIENGQKNGLLFYRLGYSYAQTGDTQKALSIYKKSLDLNPNPNLARVVAANIAKIYAEKNQPDSAIANIKRAINMGYSNLYEIENDTAFNHIRSHADYIKLHDQVLYAAYPCKTQNEARWFDFWIGEWDAFVTGTKNLAGISKIEKISGDCAILENWTNVKSSFNGKSINFYNVHTQKWEQHWVGSSGGYQKFENGEFKDDAMRFTFTRINSDQTVSIGRFIFFNQGPNQVRQFSESSNDEGKTWVVDYDFTYIRKNSNQK